MRYGRLGHPNLTDDRKASIVAAKQLQVFTHQRIARDHGVSRRTVVNLTEDKLSPEAKLKLQSFTEKLGSARVKIIDRIHEKLDNNDFKDGVYPNLLNAVNNNYRLESDQSTSNIGIVHWQGVVEARSLQTGKSIAEETAILLSIPGVEVPEDVRAELARRIEKDEIE